MKNKEEGKKKPTRKEKEIHPEPKTKKSLGNTDASAAKKNVGDLVVWGDGDMFKLLSKASSKKEGWLKSTKAMQIDGVGCVVQVTTQQGDNVAEALTFIPWICIKETVRDGVVIGRSLSLPPVPPKPAEPKETDKKVKK